MKIKLFCLFLIMGIILSGNIYGKYPSQIEEPILPSQQTEREIAAMTEYSNSEFNLKSGPPGGGTGGGGAVGTEPVPIGGSFYFHFLVIAGIYIAYKKREDILKRVFHFCKELFN